MQNRARGIAGETSPHYRERLAPSLWAMIAAAVVAPMAALVLAPIDTTLALVAGAVIGAALIGLLVLGAPLIEVRDGILTAGRAHIPVELLGDARVYEDEDARYQRGAGLHPRCWHVIRGGIDAVVVVTVVDPDDPAPTWVLSSRTPDRLVAALQRAQAKPRTPRR